MYQAISLASNSATQQGATAENPYSIALNHISTAIWSFPKEPAATMNLAIIQLLAAEKKLKNMNCCMMCYKKATEEPPYTKAVDAILARKIIF